MKTKLREKSKTQLLLEVEVPEQAVDQKLEEIYRRVVRDMEMPGFRRGKIPRSLLEARFGEDFFNDDSQTELIQEYLPQALEEHKLKPVSEPQTNVVQFERGRPFIFEVEVEILPKVEVKEYKGIEVSPEPKKRATKKEVEKAVELLRKEQATLIPKEGELVEQGDVAIIDERISSIETGEVIRDEKNVELEISQEDKIAAKLLGKKVGDEVEMELDEEYKTFIKIEELKQIELPELDDEFARDLGHESSEELKEKVKQDLREQFKREHEQAMKLKVLDAIVERTKIEVPERMIEELVQRDPALFKERGLPQPSKEEIAKYRERAKRGLKRELVLEAVKGREEIDDEELEELLEEEAGKRGMDVMKFKALLEREDQLEFFRKDLENKRVLDLLYKHAVIKKEQR